ncbi:MAG: hypothetical protein NC080_01565 [Paraprevotella sp.]|nr:hypothetical protein [Paraprevotella sp.]
MSETSNKTIALNSLILYAKLIITAICGLLSTRFALQALGAVDFGLFSVLGSVISFIAIFNTIMLSTSNRFIAISIGKGDIKAINEQFNVNLVIHVIIALVTLMLALPLGHLYVLNYINFDGNINVAINVFYISVISSIFSFVGVPFNGVIMAKEKFIVFCVTEVLSHILKVGISFLLIYFFDNKLLVYTLALGVFTAYPTIVYYIYCKRKYNEITRFAFVKEWKKYKAVLSFSAWVAYGAVASIGKTQGSALIVNTFFNTIMNAALGISNSILAIIHTFANSITQPIAPQITKSFASGDKKRCDTLLVASTKLSYMVTFLVSVPFLVDCEWILNLWLGQVPKFAVAFTKLLIIDTLISAFNSGVSTIVFASGNIKLYQVLINTLKFLAIVAAFFALKLGCPVYTLFYAYIVFSVLIAISGQVVLHITLNYDNMIIVKGSYLPSLIVTTLFLPITFLHGFMPSILYIAVSVLYVITLEFFFGFKKTERDVVINKVKSIIK